MHLATKLIYIQGEINFVTIITTSRITILPRQPTFE
uniref:Uncharacterized protein n=1 Tax=Rhizophora mucronata TaxID=61149 RepID=A0A2P2Q0C7_RHIMU